MKHVAFALYAVPEGVAAAETKHTIILTADYTPDDSSLQSQSDQFTFDLLRAPVLLVHGTWSSPRTWSDNTTGTRQKLLDAGFNVSMVDWESLNATGYYLKRDIFWRNLNDLRRDYNGSLLAFTRADVVSHSQGGNIVRLFAQDPRFINSENFHRGYFRRFIPMATPHLGTELANYVHDILQVLPQFAALALKDIARRVGYADEGAVDDLQVGSCANRSIRETPLMTHVIADECTPFCFTPESFPTALFEFVTFSKVASVAAFETFYATVFGGRINDSIVAVESQLGGLSLGGTTISYFSQVIHTDMTSDPTIGEAVVTLLEGPTGLFAPRLEAVQAIYARTGYDTGYQTCPARAAVLAAALRETQDVQLPSITIISPAEGAITTPGATLTVSVEPTNGAPIEAVLILVGAGEGTLGSAVLEHQPFTTNFTLSVKFVGDLPISVYARDTNSEISPQPVTRILRVNTTAQIVSIRVAPDTLSFTSQGSSTQLGVYGQFSDGVERNIATAAAGVVFQSSNPFVATVSTNGLIIAGTNGDAVISISAGNVTKAVDVHVRLGVPHLSSVTPNTLFWPATQVPIQVTGWDLGGISSISFLLQGTNDSSFGSTDLHVNADGTVVTGLLMVASDAAFGPMTMVVTTLGGSSASTPMPGNLFFNNPSITLSNFNVTVLDSTHTRARLELLAPASIGVILQVSPDLINWFPIQTNIGSFQYIETNSSVSSTRFFRAVTAP